MVIIIGGGARGFNPEAGSTMDTMEAIRFSIRFSTSIEDSQPNLM
jgi:hypothetical protein